MMTGTDVAVVSVVFLAGLRGVWRGLFREAFGLLGLLFGLSTSFVVGPQVADALRGSAIFSGPSELQQGVAFVGTLASVWLGASLFGYVLERAFGLVVVGVVSRAFGALAGAMKGAVCVAFSLLFLYLFVPSAASTLDDSIVSRTLVAAAGNVVRAAASGHLAVRGQ